MFAFRRILQAAFVLVAEPAIAQDMRAIDDFIAENNSNTNKSTENFIGLRCASLYLVIGGVIEIKESAASAKKFRDLSSSAIDFAINNGLKDGYYISSQIDLISKNYIEKIRMSQALTGNMFDNPVIVADMDRCKSIFLK
jgi:hypothetical protein